MEELEQRIKKIEDRNRRVELDKAWEVSKTRVFIIMILTYIFATIFLDLVDTTNPFIGSIVPVIGFLLSTQSLKIFKKFWIKNH